MLLILTQIAVFLLLATFVGAIPMYVWMRSRSEALREAHARLEAAQADRSQEQERLAALEAHLEARESAVELSPVFTRMEALEDRLSTLVAGWEPPEELSRVEEDVRMMRRRLETWHVPTEVDMRPTEAALHDLRMVVGKLQGPQDLSGLQNRLDAIERAVSSLQAEASPRAEAG